MKLLIILAALTVIIVRAAEPPSPPPRLLVVEERCPKCLNQAIIITNSIHVFSNSYIGRYELRRYDFKCNYCTNSFRRWEKK